MNWQTIYKIVIDETGIDREAIKSVGRLEKIVIARSLFAILSYRCGFSYVKIGKELNRDHTTIMHLVKSRINKNFYQEMLDKYCIELENTKKDRDKIKFRFIGMTNKKKIYKILYDKYRGKCMVCSFDEILEVHHINPRYLGGTDELSNLALLCPNHHAMADRNMLFIQPEKELLINNEIGNPQA